MSSQSSIPENSRIPPRSPFLCQFRIFGTVEPLTVIIGQLSFDKQR